MIYTSYFAQLRNMPENIIPISICLKAPNWYKGIEYKKLAPKYSFFNQWKITHDNKYYVDQFKEQVLDKLCAKSVLHEIAKMLPPEIEKCDIALICYEKPDQFCHRHLVADWLNVNGYKCDEWRNC